MTASILCINELSDTILGYIGDILDVLSILELFRVGNRLLTFKLRSPSGISRFCDLSEYGSHSYPLTEPILIQLKGLKSISVKNADHLGKLLAHLPKTMTNIDLTGENCLEACFEIRKVKEEPCRNLFSLFPHLQSISLKYPQVEL